MSDLPADWVRMHLADLCRVEYGKGLTSGDRVSSGSVPVVGSAGVVGNHDVALVSGPVVVVGRKGSAGAVHLMFDDCWPIDTTYFIRVPQTLNPRFLAWQLTRANLRSLDSSTAVPSLRRPDLEASEVVVAPRAEQDRIVAAIEEQFSRLDDAQRMLDRARVLAVRMRTALILRAVGGDWPTKPLGEFLLSLRNGIFVSRPAMEPPGIRIFRISAVRPLELDVTDVRYASIPSRQAAPYLVEPGDLLFTRYSGNSSYVGSCAVVPVGTQPTVHPDKLIRVVLDRRRAVPEFIAMAVNVGAGRQQIERRLKTTAGQVGIAGSQLKTVEIPIPPVEEQWRLVRGAEHQRSILEELMRMIDHTRIRSDHLRRSILERAFSGQLVRQDLSDEPASEMLIRISAGAMSTVLGPERRPV